MSTSYFNPSALRLIHSWVTGGATYELEVALAEGSGLRGGYSSQESLKSRDRTKVEQLPLAGSVFRKIAEENGPFGQLFGEAVLKYGMLCIGIYRLMPLTKRKMDLGSSKALLDLGDTDSVRVLISAPSRLMTLEPEDIAIMLVQYEE